VLILLSESIGYGIDAMVYGMMMMMMMLLLSTAVLQTLSVQQYCSTAARMMCYGVT
jgi:hypothetical protein